MCILAAQIEERLADSWSRPPLAGNGQPGLILTPGVAQGLLGAYEFVRISWGPPLVAPVYPKEWDCVQTMLMTTAGLLDRQWDVRVHCYDLPNSLSAIQHLIVRERI